jgi:hypothetical protein
MGYPDDLSKRYLNRRTADLLRRCRDEHLLGIKRVVEISKRTETVPWRSRQLVVVQRSHVQCNPIPPCACVLGITNTCF